MTLEGYGPLPTAARLALQRIDNVTYQPFDFAPLFHADEGQVRVPETTAAPHEFCLRVDYSSSLALFVCWL